MRFQKTVLLLQLSHKITINKAVLYISENYNRQTPSQGENHKKEKKKNKEKEKIGEERYSKRNGLEAFKARRPLQASPLTQIHKMVGLGNNATPITSGTRKQCNPNKWQNDETKHRPTTTKQSSHSGDQTLKLHHVRTPTLSKTERKLGEEYNTHHRRKAVIYKEDYTPGKVTQSVPILHRPTLKLFTLSQGKEDERAT